MVTNFCSAEGSRVQQALHDTDSFIKFQNFVFLLYLCYGYPVIRLSGYPVVRLSGYPVNRLSGYPVIRLPGYPVIRLPSYPVIRLSGTRLFYHAKWGGHIHIFVFTDCKNNRFQPRPLIEPATRLIGKVNYMILSPCVFCDVRPFLA